VTRSHGDVLGDTALDILVVIGEHAPVTIGTIAKQLYLTKQAVAWQLKKSPLDGRVRMVRRARGQKPALWELRMAE